MIRVEPEKTEWLEALALGDDVFAGRFGIVVEPGWVGFPAALPVVLAAARAGGADPWGSHLFFEDDGVLVGFGGFKGRPTGGEVEIGYAVAPSRQGRGIATAAAEVMIDQARPSGVEVVVAHTLAELNASTSVLRRCGFVHVATVDDPGGDVAGDVWRWELSLG